MTQELPKVRIARPEDEEGIMAMCRNLHSENGLFSFNDDKVRALIRRCFNKEMVIVGVIGDDVIQASICMMMTDYYYTDDWHLGELWNYVDPGFRNSRNAEALIEFGKACAVKIGLPFITGIITNKHMAGKVRLYRKLLGYPSGAFFLYNANWNPEPMADHADLRVRLKSIAHQCEKQGRLSADFSRKELAPLLYEAARAISEEDNLWSSAAKTNGHGSG
jgi:hypothetical protein